MKYIYFLFVCVYNPKFYSNLMVVLTLIGVKFGLEVKQDRAVILSVWIPQMAPTNELKEFSKSPALCQMNHSYDPLALHNNTHLNIGDDRHFNSKETISSVCVTKAKGKEVGSIKRELRFKIHP